MKPRAEEGIDANGGTAPGPVGGAGGDISARPLRPIVVAPTYNNAGTLLDILWRVGAIGLEAIVVDDGCTDETARRLEEWRTRAGGEVVRHPRNMGKARALLSGFAAAAARGYSHAVTIDTDGQHDPESIPSLLKIAEGVPAALVLGVRSEQIEGCPGRSLVGRRLSNLAIRCECGVRVRDSQCGLRVYPLELVVGERALRWRSGRFAFEAEVITRAAWAGRPIEEVDVACRYLPREMRVSHFKPWRDSLHGVALHARLLGAALLPWGGGAQRRGLEGRAGATARRPLGRRIRAWLSPMELWRQIRDERAGRAEVALGVSIGVFIANLPLYGVQTLLSLYVANRLHLHPLPVVAGSHVSTPPVGVALIGAAVAVGHWLLHGTWVWAEIAATPASGAWTMAGWMLLDWLVGSVVVGLACAAASFAGVWLLLGLVARRGARGGGSAWV